MGEGARAGERGVSPVTLQPSCVRGLGRGRERDWNPARGVAAGRGLRRQLGVQPHQDDSDGRDVVGGGCTPLLARAPATNDYPWSIHGGFTRQVRPTPSCCCRCCRRLRHRLVPSRPPVACCRRLRLLSQQSTPISVSCHPSEARRAGDARGGGFELETRPRYEEGRVRLARESCCTV